MADVGRLDTDTAVAALIRSRLVTRSMVRAAVVGAIAQGGLALAPSGAIASRSVLVRKLERGGIGPTGIRSAQRLRAVWSEHEARFRADLPGANREMEDLRTRVLDAVSSAEDRVLSQPRNDPYGPELMTQVRDSLHVDRFGRTPIFPIEDSHLLGLVYQLTDECEVWWSPEFDVEAAV